MSCELAELIWGRELDISDRWDIWWELSRNQECRTRYPGWSWL